MCAWNNGFQVLVPQEVCRQVEPLDVGILDPGDGEVETAFSHSLSLRVRRQHPFVDADPRIRNGRYLRGEPADVTQSEGQLSCSPAGSIESPLRGIQHLASIGQELRSGGRQLYVATVTDQELGP